MNRPLLWWRGLFINIRYCSIGFTPFIRSYQNTPQTNCGHGGPDYTLYFPSGITNHHWDTWSPWMCTNSYVVVQHSSNWSTICLGKPVVQAHAMWTHPTPLWNHCSLHSALLTTGVYGLIRSEPHSNPAISPKWPEPSLIGIHHILSVLQGPISDITSPVELQCPVLWC